MSELTALNRDELLNLDDVEIEEVDMNQWWPGKKVFVRSMTVADRDSFEAEGLKREGKGKKTPLRAHAQRHPDAAPCPLPVRRGRGVTPWSRGH